ncbi:hypothetical protein [Flavivirga aquatica]|nr:hypothetical protein [Flavivirga aquatica]
MRTKKHLITLAIVCGMFFTTYAANAVNQDDQQTEEAPPKKKIKNPNK